LLVTGARPSGSVRVFVAAALVCFGAAACSSSKHASAKPAQAEVVSTQAALKIGSVSVESAGPNVNVDKNTQKAVLARAQQYVDTAMIAPLSSGTVGSGYGPLFDDGVRLAATTTDANTLTDSGIGKTTGFDEKTTPVTISALADQLGGIDYLATNFTVNISAKTSDGPATIARTVELTFAPSGKSWLVTAYRVHAVRKLPSGTTSTTANAGGGG
jgi:hypothetical protein